MEDLGTLGGPEAGLLGSKGNVEMNENGQIVACSFTNSTLEPCDRHPYRKSFPLRKKVSA